VRYARAFFDLQLRFAHTVSALSGLPLARALLEYTNLYIRFGLGHAFDPAHPVWREYLAGPVGYTKDGREWTYRFYLGRPPADPPDVVATFGCFAYARLAGDRIRLHFRNAETGDHSPLGDRRQAARRAELAALFEHVKRTTEPAPRVVGRSWLYNLEAYRRLFPESYVRAARPIDGRFQHMPLWGQFVDRRGEVKEGMAQELLERLGRQSGLEGLDRCFPLPVLAAEAPSRAFCEFYGV
jgi:hypothetical protein